MISAKASQSNANLELNTVLATALVGGNKIVQGSNLSKQLRRICEQFSQSQSSEEAVFCIELDEHQRVVEYEPSDQVISVETGIKVARLNDILREQNQYFPCSEHSQQSLLDVINSGDAGHLEHSTSGMRSLVFGLTVALPSGDIIKTGGKVVKNVSGYDITKLFVGARGSLGLPLQAHLRIFAKPQQSVTLAFFHERWSVLQNSLNKLLATGITLSACEYFNGNQIPLSECNLSLTKMMSGESIKSMLLLNVSEHQSVVAELVPQIESFMSVDGIQKQECDEIVFAELEQIVGERDWAVETSIDQERFAILHQFLLQEKIQSYYRPGNGRLKILASDEQKMQSVCQKLKSLALIEQPLVVAIPKGGYEYYVEQYPQEDPALAIIKSRIKAQYDPDNRLNPFAKM